ncbi:MAG: bifunctional phosphopantothenoylcysteine decarboxylase/phosphopantothenate synthase [Thermoprotei archaeon ex4572_64]|nr:MAG: bifunctional phosphopantothenoylcysteine decarboxylase/phosphopantothenate synthase [Thermoprotei archaeon ex4572_64]
MLFVENIEVIRGKLSNLLNGRFILLGLTGSVAIYRVPDIARLLIKHGAEVKTLMTSTARSFLNPEIMRWATGNDVITEVSGYVEYVNLCSKADALVIVPATANTISKIAQGISDNVVTLSASVTMGFRKKLIIIPVMNLSMYMNPVFRDNLNKLTRYENVHIIEPIIEEGKAKIPPNNEIVESIIDTLCAKDMKGLNVLITTGPTREYIDDVKYITTPSSGLTGLYFAREAKARGADVTVITGAVNINFPEDIEVIRVESVLEMYEKTMKVLENKKFDIIVLSAAPLDYTVKNRVKGKLHSDLDKLCIELVKAPKIACTVRSKQKDAIIIGFKAEVNVSDEELIDVALKKLNECSWDLAIAHDVGRGLGFSTLHDDVYIITNTGEIEKTGKIHKRELARIVYNKIMELKKVR